MPGEFAGVSNKVSVGCDLGSVLVLFLGPIFNSHACICVNLVFGMVLMLSKSMKNTVFVPFIYPSVPFSSYTYNNLPRPLQT